MQFYADRSASDLRQCSSRVFSVLCPVLFHLMCVYHAVSLNYSIKLCLELYLSSPWSAYLHTSRVKYSLVQGPNPQFPQLWLWMILCPQPGKTGPSWRESLTEGLPGVIWCMTTIFRLTRMGLPRVDWPSLKLPESEEIHFCWARPLLFSAVLGWSLHSTGLRPCLDRMSGPRGHIAQRDNPWDHRRIWCSSLQRLV